MDATKYCPCCQTTKPVDQFRIDTARKGGRQGYCKLCRKASDVRSRLKRIEDGSLADYLAKRRVIELRSENKNRESHRAVRAYYSKSNPIKRRAHAMVKYRIRKGEIIVGPCEICGKVKADAHHDDYAQPLAIRWLCSFHHRDWHLRNGPGLNGTLPQEKAA